MLDRSDATKRCVNGRPCSVQVADKRIDASSACRVRVVECPPKQLATFTISDRPVIHAKPDDRGPVDLQWREVSGA